jgi:hypothetical protein
MIYTRVNVNTSKVVFLGGKKKLKFVQPTFYFSSFLIISRDNHFLAGNNSRMFRREAAK